jgi:hypothetical protein
LLQLVAAWLSSPAEVQLVPPVVALLLAGAVSSDKVKSRVMSIFGAGACSTSSRVAFIARMRSRMDRDPHSDRL